MAEETRSAILTSDSGLEGINADVSSKKDVSSTQPPSSPRTPRSQIKRLSSRKSSLQSTLMRFAFLRIKKLVSKKKRRYRDGEYDLDLTYVTPRIIAMGFPSENIEGIFRNHLRDVQDFLQEYHGDQYKLFNLCCERKYSKNKFDGRVSEFGFKDHCPPPLELFKLFCEDAHSFVEQDPENVIVVHCKAGKGRTGVMICAYLLYSGRWLTCEGALNYYAAVRSLNHQGVTIPSQRRFVQYFSKMLDRGNDLDQARVEREKSMTRADFIKLWEDGAVGSDDASQTEYKVYPPIMPDRVHLVIKAIRFAGMYPRQNDVVIRTKCEHHLIKTTQQASQLNRVSMGNDTEVLDIELEAHVVWDEVHVSFDFGKGKVKGHFWFHTSFIRDNKLILQKHEIDKAVKDVKRGHKLYAEDMSIQLDFELARRKDLKNRSIHPKK